MLTETTADGTPATNDVNVTLPVYCPLKSVAGSTETKIDAGATSESALTEIIGEEVEIVNGKPSAEAAIFSGWANTGPPARTVNERVAGLTPRLGDPAVNLRTRKF